MKFKKKLVSKQQPASVEKKTSQSSLYLVRAETLTVSVNFLSFQKSNFPTLPRTREQREAQRGTPGRVAQTAPRDTRGRPYPCPSCVRGRGLRGQSWGQEGLLPSAQAPGPQAPGRVPALPTVRPRDA